MKLRLRGDSLRLRLTATEVAALRDQGAWQDATTLGPAGAPLLAYRVESVDLPAAEVRYTADNGTTVTVALPSADVAHWADSASEVGIYFQEPWGLKVAVEKDFRCLDPRRDEDESDNFDNPNAGDSQHAACHTTNELMAGVLIPTFTGHE